MFFDQGTNGAFPRPVALGHRVPVFMGLDVNGCILAEMGQNALPAA